MVFSQCVDTEACLADELTSDPNDCHAYMQCFNGRLYHLSCGPNASFDGVTGACISASRVAGCDVIGSSDSTESECDTCPGYSRPTIFIKLSVNVLLTVNQI